MRRVVAIVVSVLLLAVGAGAILVAPTGERLGGPVPVPGGPNHRVAGNELAITVHDVHLARTLNGDPGTATAGVWVVIDVTATGAVRRVTLDNVTLHLGDTTYSRPADLSGGITAADAGIPARGSIVFEVSRAALRTGAAHTELEVRTTGDVFPESAPLIGMDLSSLSIQRSIDVGNPTLEPR